MKPTRNTVLVIILAAMLIQLLIITYNHVTGFLTVGGVLEFAARLAFGTFFTALFGGAVFFIDAWLIRRFDRRVPWTHSPALRSIMDFLSAVVVGVVAGVTLTAVVHLIAPYADGLQRNAVNNALITAVINLIVVTVTEALLWFRRGQDAQLAAERLQRENLQLRFETLKQQLNPHFLFNSLNTLSSLIGRDDERAQSFVDEFSAVYRYTLDVIDRPTVALSEELAFAREYLSLQQTRFRDGVIVETRVDGDLLQRRVPPLAVQALLENAFKHNAATRESPLRIFVETEGDALVVRNALQPRYTQERRSGVGMENLRQRYALVSDRAPRITVTDTEYVVSLPLLD
ncbi:MAG: histidine kinase [Bacteroidota bacterium]|nr:histidine kinase [Bacteroidota bacterium]